MILCNYFGTSLHILFFSFPKFLFFFRVVEAANEETFGTYKQSESQRHSKLEQLVAGHVQDQTSLCGESRSKIKAHAGRRAEERTQLTDAYGDTVEKLIQTMGDIERVTSEHMYTEQSWVEQLLKRVKFMLTSNLKLFYLLFCENGG